jgi:hypothetical protein
MTEDEPTDLTALMTLDPLQLSKQDLDRIIAYQRKQRVQREAGGKTKRAKEAGPAIDIKALMGKIAVPAPAKPVPTTPGKGFQRRL